MRILIQQSFYCPERYFFFRFLLREAFEPALFVAPFLVVSRATDADAGELFFDQALLTDSNSSESVSGDLVDVLGRCAFST